MFDNKKRELPNVSKIFMIGLAIIENPVQLRQDLNALREQFLNDPCYAGTPSFHPDEEKTAVMFHAKNDIEAVRLQVYEKLCTVSAKVTVVIRRKDDMKSDAKRIFNETGKRLSDDIIYDNIVTKLFKYISHQKEDCEIKFAIKKKQRNKALLSAIRNTQNDLRNSGHKVTTNISVSSEYSRNDACLQVIDYFLWALHRLYIYQQDTYMNYIKDKFNVILDLDDQRNSLTGEMYTRHNPIEVVKLKPV